MKLKIDKQYLWMPIGKKAEKVCLHLFENKKKIDEINIRLCLDFSDFLYYTYKDLTAYQGKEIEIIRYDERALDTLFLYNEKPQNVYPFRPKLHFSPESGWCNDPCGLYYQKGIYHMYYQYNPYGIEWDNMHWGHAESRDLICWKHMPIALSPDERGSAYTGSAILDKQNLLGYGKNTPLFYYSAAGGKNEWSRNKGKHFTQRLAVSLDDGLTLQRDERFLMENKANMNRDPIVFWHEESKGYIMTLFLDGNMFVILRSNDLLNWAEIQRLNIPGAWECPNLFSVAVEGSDERKWIFWTVEGFYLIGTFDGYHFTSESKMKRGFYTKNLHAAQIYANTGERTIMVSWIMMENARGNYKGIMSIPCELTLCKTDEDVAVKFWPVSELGSRKTETLLFSDFAVAKFDAINCPYIVHFVWEKRSGMTVFRVGDEELIFDFAAGRFQARYNSTGRCVMRTEFKVGEVMLIVDQEVIEIFLDDGSIYGVIETEENILGKNIYIESDIKIKAAEIIKLTLI